MSETEEMGAAVGLSTMMATALGSPSSIGISSVKHPLERLLDTQSG